MKRFQRAAAFLLLSLIAAFLLPVGAFSAEVPGDGEYVFSGDEFGELDGIYVSSVPDSGICVVCMGQRVIRSGDFLADADLSALSIRSTCNENLSGVFLYRPIANGILGEEKSLPVSILSTRNDPPEAQDISFETYKNVANRGTLRAKDPEGEQLTFRLEDRPRQGTVELLEDGEFVYTPKHNKVGDDSFSYAAVDAAGNVSNTATVRVKILRPLDAQTFADLGETEQFLAMWMREKDLYGGMQVTDQLCFAPDETVSRGEFLAMTMKLAGIEPEIGLTSSGFSDQDRAPRWMQPYLASAMRRGIARGISTENGLEFRPNEPITAVEAAVLLCRTFHLNGVQAVSATDAENTVPAWAQSSVQTLTQAGVTVSAAGDRPMTFAEAAKLLYSVSGLR